MRFNMGIYQFWIKNQFFRISLLNSISVFLKIVLGVVSAKISAIYIGPAGMAMVGNLKNFISVAETIATLGFQNGILKYVAEKKDNRKELSKFLSTIAICVGCMTLFLCFFLVVFRNFFSYKLFGSSDYSMVYIAICVLLPFYVGSILFLHILNGLGDFKKIIQLTIIANCIGLLFTIILVSNFETVGALLAFISAQSFMIFLNFYYLQHKIPIFELLSFQNFDKIILRSMIEFTIMSIFSAVLVPLVYLSIRQNVTHNFGLISAGYWVTIDLISSYYFIFVSSILSLYFLPKLATSYNFKTTKKIFLNYYKTVIPCFAVALLAIYFLRSTIISLVFTKEFVPVENLFAFQLIGDFFKAASLILAYNLIARKNTKAFLAFEVASISMLYLLSELLLPIYGLKGIVMAHAMNYVLYFAGLVVYHRKILVAVPHV